MEVEGSPGVSVPLRLQRVIDELLVVKQIEKIGLNFCSEVFVFGSIDTMCAGSRCCFTP